LDKGLSQEEQKESEFSAHSYEDEVLLLPNAAFAVDKITPDGSKKAYRVELTQTN
jgi:hypothetical protein